MSARVVLAGIDEAGLGPLLGSLAIGFALLEAPAREPDPWRRLRPTVAKTPSKRARLVVGDSKVVFQRTERGARRLEETVLAFRTLAGQPARSAREFLFTPLAPPPPYAALPWGEDLPALPLDSSADALELDTSVLARALARAELAVLECGVRLVPAAELNASFAETGNKAETVWARVLGVLARAWSARRRGTVRCTVDMLGGRRRYGAPLARAFPEAAVALVEERVGRSAYTLEARDGSGRMELEFRVKGETHAFATALASCAAKYARELEMRAFNAYFRRYQPELTPTAGYREDGKRWLDEAGPALARSGLARELLVRTR